MTFDKRAYMRDYMQRKRAEQPTALHPRRLKALHDIVKLVEGKTGDVATQIRNIAQDAIGE